MVYKVNLVEKRMSKELMTGSSWRKKKKKTSQSELAHEGIEGSPGKVGVQTRPVFSAVVSSRFPFPPSRYGSFLQNNSVVGK